ncbi:MAG: hypothetical protein ACLQNV_17950 [Steroidobacteraceae bacterium]
MAENDQAPSPALDYAEAQAVDGNAPVSFSEVVWVFGEILPQCNILPVDTAAIHHVGDSDHLLAATVSSEAPVNLDHALDQLTTTTDLFDVPVLDFHSS